MANEPSQIQQYHLQPGYIFCAREAATIHAVVGSCVAVCLWDTKLEYGGMNHFLYPRISQARLATPQYGNAATIELIRMMERIGSQREHMLAQILGGASMGKVEGISLGEQNIRAAREVLGRKGIHIGSEDTGGSMGRKIVFDTSTGHVMVLKVHKIREDDWNG